MGPFMDHWSNETRFDPLVVVTLLFGVVAAALLATAL
jgi:hypothetical protein